jgi:MoaA/NifB/PqqE/SkfB family radical SAM enzyme
MRTPHTVGFKTGERNIFLHLLTACNLSCAHCYINPSEHGSSMLSRGQIESWIRLFSDPAKESNIVFLGGEPTMHPDLVYGIEVAKSCGYAVTVDTNGYLFHDFLERVNPDHLDYLSFSLDGPDPGINDPIRGDGVFEVCTANLKEAVKRGISTSLIYTVSSRNIDGLERMAPLLEELKVKRFFIQVIGLRGKSASAAHAGATPLQVDPERWLEVVPAVAEAVSDRGITVVYPKVFLNEGELFECAGNVAENFFIFPNGRVYQCPLCEDYPIHSYEIRDDRLVKIDGLTEERFFKLDIAEGCVMNKLLQPDTIVYDRSGKPVHRVSCCLLKQQLS